MQTVIGIISVIQESRFRLDTDEGRSLQFTLAARAPIEPQELSRFSGRRVAVESDGVIGMSGYRARNIGQVPT